MDRYRISQAAERAGMPATTLRYCETRGLLPARHTASGYEQADRGGVTLDTHAPAAAGELLRELLG